MDFIALQLFQNCKPPERRNLAKKSSQMALVRRRDGEVMCERKCDLYGCSCNNLVELVLPNRQFLDTLRILIAFANTFKMDYGTFSSMLALRILRRIYFCQTISVEPVLSVLSSTQALQSLSCAILRCLSISRVLRHLHFESSILKTRYWRPVQIPMSFTVESAISVPIESHQAKR